MKTMEMRNLPLDELTQLTAERLDNIFRGYLENTPSL